MPVKNSVILMNKARISRALIRMAYQIYEECRGDRDIILIGINQRGYWIAEHLAFELGKILRTEVSVLKIFVDEKRGINSEESIYLQGKYVVIVDDVIFSGKTIHEAIHNINQYGEPRRMMLAVLVDRGHRLFPIEAQFVGMISPTKLDEHVSVIFSNEGDVTEVVLEKD